MYYAKVAEENRKETFSRLLLSVVPAEREDLKTHKWLSSVYNGFVLLGAQISTVEYHGQLFSARSNEVEFDVDLVATTTYSRLLSFFEAALN